MEYQKITRPSAVMLTADRRVDRRILLEAEALRSAGWDVQILAMPLDTGFNLEDLAHGIERIGRASVSRRSSESIAVETYKWLRSHLPMNGWAMRQIKRFAWRFLIDQESFYEKLFLPSAHRLTPKVFVAHDLPMLPLACKLAKKTGAKLVYDSHELYAEQEFSKWEKKRWFDIEARYINSADAVITVNQSIAEELRKRYGIPKVEVIYNSEKSPFSLDSAHKIFHAKLGLDPKAKILLLQGGISEGRNIDVLVAAMEYVKNNVCLVLLGDGVYAKSLKKIVNKIGLSSRVYFMPAVPQDQLLTLTASADAGVIPYQPTCLNNYYCTPNKLFEFIAVGLPIVASDLPEIKRIVQGNEIGLVGATNNPKSFAKLIDQFFSDETRFTKWKSNLKSVQLKLTWEAQKINLIKVYHGLLN